MVVFSVLGAAMLSLTSSSTFSQVASTSATKAYYLAEAGMRYAASEFRNAGNEDAKDNRMEAIHNHNFAMSSEGSFHLDIYPYYFKTTTDPNGTVSLHAKFPGGVPTGMAIPTSGYLKIRSEDAPRQYTSYTQSGSTITFTMAATLPSFTINSNVLPVGLASSTTLSKSGNLTLSSGAGAFPLINGTFTIGTSASTKSSDNNVYAYKTRSGSTLQGVTLSQTPTQAFTATVPANAYITSMKFVNVQSRGTVAPGSPLEAIRTIDYSIPIGWVSGSG
ncbi:MAG: hypothetical protein NTV68_15225, partial [Methanomicrobiales archaeon]|nr:hypothetical protein [Methanomicrobiales archaeon]